MPGLDTGNTGFMLLCTSLVMLMTLKQLVAVALSSVWAFGFTYGMLWLIDRVTPVRVGEKVEAAGLDSGLHREEAYVGAL